MLPTRHVLTDRFAALAVLPLFFIALGCSSEPPVATPTAPPPKDPRSIYRAPDRDFDPHVLFSNMVEDGASLIGGIERGELGISPERLKEGCINDVHRSNLIALSMAIRHRDTKVRVFASEILGLMGELAQPVAHGLANALLDPDPRVRVAAATTLEQFSEENPSSILKHLLIALEDSEPQVRRGVIRSIANVGVPASEASTKLAENAEHNNSLDEAAEATLALAKVDPEHEALSRLAAKIVREGNAAQVQLAIKALQNMERGDESLANPLLALLSDRRLVKITDAQAIGEILSQLDGQVRSRSETLHVLYATASEPWIRLNAAAATFGSGKSDSVAGAKQLVSFFKSSDNRIKRTAAIAIAHLGRRARFHIEPDILLDVALLPNADGSPSEALFSAAFSTLGFYGDKAAPALNRLSDVVEGKVSAAFSGNIEFRTKAAEALLNVISQEGRGALVSHGIQRRVLISSLISLPDEEFRKLEPLIRTAFGGTLDIQAKLLTRIEELPVTSIPPGASQSEIETATAHLPTLYKEWNK